MPESPDRNPLPYAVEPGISEKLADDARKDALVVYKEAKLSNEPLQFLEHTECSRAASNAYLVCKGSSKRWRECLSLIKKHRYRARQSW